MHIHSKRDKETKKIFLQFQSACRSQSLNLHLNHRCNRKQMLNLKNVQPTVDLLLSCIIRYFVLVFGMNHESWKMNPFIVFICELWIVKGGVELPFSWYSRYSHAQNQRTNTFQSIWLFGICNRNCMSIKVICLNSKYICIEYWIYGRMTPTINMKTYQNIPKVRCSGW